MAVIFLNGRGFSQLYKQWRPFERHLEYLIAQVRTARCVRDLDVIRASPFRVQLQRVWIKIIITLDLSDDTICDMLNFVYPDINTLTTFLAYACFNVAHSQIDSPIYYPHLFGRSVVRLCDLRHRLQLLAR